MKNKIILTVTVITIIILFLIKYPVVFFSDSLDDISNEKYSDKIFPLEKVNSKDCEIFIYISNDDFGDLPSNIKKHRVIYTKNPTVINELKNIFWFNRTGGDMTTCDSRIIVYSDNKVVFNSKIVLSNNLVGIQGNFGWAEASNNKKIIDIISIFKPKYYPMIYFY